MADSPGRRPPLVDVGDLHVDAAHVFEEAFGTKWPRFLREAAKSLAPLQIDGVAAALDRFSKGKQDFLFADGTGTGKGPQIILLAAAMAEKTGKPSLLATKNHDLAEELRRDAASLGIDPEKDNLAIGSFDDLATMGRDKKGRPVEYGLAAFDEAGAIPDPSWFSRIQAENRVYATATPFSELESRRAVYLLAALKECPGVEMAKRLHLDAVGTGASLRYRRDEPPRSPGRVLRAVGDVSRELYAEGAMVRREYPFWGEVSVAKVPLSAEARRDERRVTAGYDRLRASPGASPDLLRELDKREARELELGALHAKADAAVARCRAALARGEKVILYGEQEPFTPPGGRRSVDFLSEVEKRLAAVGVPAARLRSGPGEEKNQAELARFEGKPRKIAAFIADEVAAERKVVVRIGEREKGDGAAFAEALAARLRKKGIDAAMEGTRGAKSGAPVVLSVGHSDTDAGGGLRREGQRTVLTIPYEERPSYREGRAWIKDGSGHDERPVILMPMQFSEGFSNLVHYAIGDVPRTVIQAGLTTGSDVNQIAGRVSRGPTRTPSRYELLVAPDSRFDRLQSGKVLDDLAVLEAAGNTWAAQFRDAFQKPLGHAAGENRLGRVAEYASEMRRSTVRTRDHRSATAHEADRAI